MPAKRRSPDIHELLLEAHRKGIEDAIDLSIRTGVPLAVAGKDGKIRKIKPKYKYVLVPIKSTKTKRSPHKAKPKGKK